MRLWNGIELPQVGFGTYGIMDMDVILQAIQTGYTLIDTAAHYFNEQLVGGAVKKSGKRRDELFVVTKLWYSDMGYDAALKAFDESLSRLALEYIDLYLIHWPAAVGKYPEWKKTNRETWKALEELYLSKKVRAIGVSNFMERHLDALMDDCRIKPMVDQIENHPGFYQKRITEFCNRENIRLMAWSPLGAGEVLNNDKLKSIGEKYQKTSAQICLRWNLQHAYLPIPKSKTCERMRENLELFDFTLSEEDMESIDALPFCGGQGAVVQ